jgi:hypothetical protein
MSYRTSDPLVRENWPVQHSSLPLLFLGCSIFRTTLMQGNQNLDGRFPANFAF